MPPNPFPLWEGEPEWEVLASSGYRTGVAVRSSEREGGGSVVGAAVRAGAGALLSAVAGAVLLVVRIKEAEAPQANHA